MDQRVGSMCLARTGQGVISQPPLLQSSVRAGLAAL